VLTYANILHSNILLNIIINSITMTNTNLKDFMVCYLQNEYKWFSHILNNYYLHVERCHSDHIITINERILYLKNFNEIIKNMNDIYNNKMNELKEKDFIDQESNDENINDNSKNIKDMNIDNYLQDLLNKTNCTKELIELTKIYESLNINKLYGFDLNIFEETKSKLLNLSTTLGFYNMNDSLDLLIGKKHHIFFNSDNKSENHNYYQILLKYFVPLSFKKNKYSGTKTLISCDQKNSEYEILFDNHYEIIICISERKIKLTFFGYFANDPLNIAIRTCQISEHFLYNKKKILSDHIHSKFKYINDNFKNNYIKSLLVGDIISLTKNKLSEKIENDYDKYTKLSKLSFKNLMQDFLSENSTIKTQFNTIKLLLIANSEESTNLAGLLFGLTKDKKIGGDYLSNIIHKNLNYTSQTRLRKSSTTIKTELDKLKNITSDNIDIKKQIVLCKNMPLHVKKIAVDKAEEMKSGSSEFYKQKTYLDVLLNFPWPSPNDNEDDIFSNIGSDLSESRNFLNKLKNTLDNKVYGHNECKSVVQELIGKWLTNPKSPGKVIGLAGPPGVGKTMIAKSLGDAMGIPFTQINLGGMEDRCVLSGHSYTYSAAQPGLILRKMIEAGKPRCIMYFDELDKACTKHGINEIYNVLIHVTDPNTNSQFSDAFFNETTFRLDKVLFVFSYNDAGKIDKILLDRMEKIDVKPYTTADKLIIFKQFLIKEVSEGIGIDHNFINFQDADVEYIIDNFTFEAGVRELKRKLETIFLKLNLDRIFGRGPFENQNPKNILITREHIDKYLNKPNLNIKKIHEHNDIGIINGLYATNSGSGGIIPILVYNNFVGTKNKFVLKITGSQGKIMKESVSFAFTTAMNIIKSEYRQKFLENCPFGLHIHTPDGATPKDGPSAGSAFTTAFISRILNKKIKKDIAMTGEIEMSGNITAIGGLEYKLKGAQKAGVKTVFIPTENKSDLDKILEKDITIQNDIKIHLVSHIFEILKIALIDETENDKIFNSEKYLTINK